MASHSNVNPNSVGIFVTKAQYAKHDGDIKACEAVISAKRQAEDPHKVHKWNPIAFVETSLVIVFQGGEIIDTLSFALDKQKAHSLGPSSFKQLNANDVRFNVDRGEMLHAFRAAYPNFRLKVGEIGDGCCSGTIADAYTVDGASRIATFAYDPS